MADEQNMQPQSESDSQPISTASAEQQAVPEVQQAAADTQQATSQAGQAYQQTYQQPDQGYQQPGQTYQQQAYQQPDQAYQQQAYQQQAYQQQTYAQPEQPYQQPYSQPYYQQPSSKMFRTDIMTGGEKAFDIILSIFFPLITPVAMWFCWRLVAPEKAKKALLYGLITSAIIIALGIITFVITMNLIIAVMNSSAVSGGLTGLGSSYGTSVF